MRVAVDAQLASNRTTFRGAGVARYSLSLLKALAGRDDITIEAFVNARSFAGGDLSLVGIEPTMSRLPLDNPLARIIWEQAALPVLARRSESAVLHGLVNVLPLASTVPGVVTVHDLVYLRHPETMRRSRRLYQSKLCSASVSRAREVIAVSEQTARDLHELLEVPTSKISVVPNGVDDRFRREPTPVETGLGVGPPAGPFALYLGTLEPRKNLATLVRAFHASQSGRPGPFGGRDWRLVLAGGKGWFYDELFDLVRSLGLEDRVVFPGFIPDNELPAWYRAADVFVYPSLFEGFGLPVLEAMACGTAVVCGSTGAVAEVAGDAALTVDVTDARALGHAVASAMSDAGLRADLSLRGPARAAQFRWDRTADETIEVYRRAGR